MISVQQHDFNVQQEYQALKKGNETGAVVIFVGLVRDFQQPSKHFELQHYPGMTENTLQRIAETANQRWSLQKIRIIHRVGKLKIEDQIVFVGVSSEHRGTAFDACEYIIDILKTEAPFWKKEGEHWVEAKLEDQTAAHKWLTE